MIFVVEDDHGVRELELYALRQSGYEAEGYETPAAFRQALEKTVPDCVLLDVMLPGEDGLSLLRFLRRAIRDSLFRSSPVEHTLKQWNSVRRGERLYISPYRGQADLTVDTYLPYETNILMQYLSEKLQGEERMFEQADLAPLSAILDKVSPIDYKPYMPEDSVLHEFIG